jgi:hypothetical protein
MLFFLKLNNPHCGKMLTVTSVHTCDDKKFENNTATKHRQIEEPVPGKAFIVMCRLVALLLALAVSTPVLLADDGDHDRFVDPIVGSWIVHVTIDTIEIIIPPPNPPPVLPIKFDNVAALTADGITADFSPPSTTLYGPWEKVGPRIYRQKIVTVNEGGGNTTAFTGPLVLNQQGDQISGPMRTIVTDKNGQVTLEYSGTLLFNRITFTSTP